MCKKYVVILMILILSVFVVSCDSGPKVKTKVVKIEITGPNLKGTKVFGHITADHMQGAGFGRKNFEIVIPGSVEVKCGPSSYSIGIMAWSKRSMKCKIYIDGVEIKPPTVLVENRDDGYSAMFEIKPEKPVKK